VFCVKRIRINGKKKDEKCRTFSALLFFERHIMSTTLREDDRSRLSCAWRVDVTVSSSQAKRVLRPTVLMTLSRNRDHRLEEKTFEMSLEMFRELRVTVAKMLTEMKWTREEMERTEDD